MAKLKDQYNEIFDYVGKKFGLSKLTYETYLGLNKDDVRKKHFDDFIANNLPIDKAMDKGFSDLVTKLNGDPNLSREDRIDDVKSFNGLGEKLYPTKKENNEEAPKTSFIKDTKKKNKKDKKQKISIMSGIRTVYNAIAVGANIIAFSFIGGGVVSGILLGLPSATIISTAVPFLWVPAITIGIPVAINAIKFAVKNIRSGNAKKWFKSIGKKLGLSKEIKSNEREVQNELEQNNVVENQVYFPDETIVQDTALVPTEEAKTVVPNKNNLPEESYTEKLNKVIGSSNQMLLPSGEGIDYSAYNQPQQTVTEKVNDNDQNNNEKNDNIYTKDLNNIDNNKNIDLSFSSDDYNVNDNLNTNIDKINDLNLTKEKTQTRQPKHAKKTVEGPSKEELEDRIGQLEWRLEQLNAGGLKNESEEKIRYVESMKENIRKEIAKVKKELKKFEEPNIGNILRSRKANLVQKLNKIQPTEENKQLITDIQIAIDYIDQYIASDRNYKQGKISKEELQNQENLSYMSVEYIMDESLRRKK